MQSIKSLRVDSTGWVAAEGSATALAWSTADGDRIGVYYFGIPPDIGAQLSDPAGVRRFYSTVAYSAGLAVIEIELRSVSGCAGVRTIFKQAQEPHGMTYIGSLTLPFRDFSYVLKVACPELGVTGLREAVVFHECLAKGLVEVASAASEEARPYGWMRDPYDADIRAPLLRNLSESEDYDAKFPAHPLSRARRLLRHLEATTVIGSEVRRAKPWVPS